MTDPSRRRLLRWAAGFGAGLLSGCAGEDDAAAAASPTLTSGGPMPTGTPPPRSPSTTRATEPPRTPDIAGTWPMFQYDAHNGGRAPATGLKTGVHRRWSFEAAGPVRSSPAIVADTVYVGAGRHLYACRLADGRPRWQVEADGRVDASPAVVDGTVFVNSDPGTVYAVDAASGEVRWQQDTGQAMPAETPRTSSPTVVDGTVYVGLHTEVWALDATTGAEQWRKSVGGLISGAAPAVADGMLYTGHAGGELVALNASDGEVRWRTPLAAFVTCPPTVHEGQVYVGAADGQVHELAAATGSVERTFETEFDPDLPGTPLPKINASPAVASGILIVGSNDYHAYGWDLESGERRWRFRVGGRCYTAPAIADGVVHVGGVAGRLYGLAVETGEPLWAFQLPGEVLDSSPAVVDHAVCVGDSTGRIHLLQGRD